MWFFIWAFKSIYKVVFFMLCYFEQNLGKVTCYSSNLNNLRIPVRAAGQLMITKTHRSTVTFHLS
jgi:hypothetical protein